MADELAGVRFDDRKHQRFNLELLSVSGLLALCILLLPVHYRLLLHHTHNAGKRSQGEAVEKTNLNQSIAASSQDALRAFLREKHKLYHPIFA